jgi:hypothetical protein
MQPVDNLLYTANRHEACLPRDFSQIYRPHPEVPLSSENIFYLDALQQGRLGSIPISLSEIRKAGFTLRPEVGRAPEAAIFEKWAQYPMTDSEVIEPLESIADAIPSARKQSYGEMLLVDGSAKKHIEAQDFSKVDNLRNHFFYLEKGGLHRRRIEMLADLGVYEIRKALSKKGTASVINFGPGPFPFERVLTSKLSKEERRKTHICGLDVSRDMLFYGLSTNYIDRGIAVDISSKGPEYLIQRLPTADVVIFAEILEHIFHDAQVFKEQMIPWLKRTNAFLIGSVPNAVQLPELIPLMTGTGSPHQLARPIFDKKNDHVSHHSVESLLHMIDEWGYRESGIVSNAVRLEKDGDVAHLQAGLSSPSLGDRLIFWAKNIN